MKIFMLRILVVLIQTLFCFSAYSNTCVELLAPNYSVDTAVHGEETGLPKNSSSDINSDEILNNPPLSIRYFISEAQKRFKGKELQPTFINPAEDKKLVPLWAGTTDVPQMIKDTLIDETSHTGKHSTAVLDYSLVTPDKGAVKSSKNGSFISLRWNEEWYGRNMSTNMGVYAPTLVKASVEKEHSYIVSSDAKAVVMALHGGGTATTGHHVFIGLTNFLGPKGFAVVSLDAPKHGYGPQEDLSPREYLKYLIDLRYKLAPKETPVIIGGHSQGGMVADILMRLSTELGVGEAFAGAFSLSPPVDEAPGQDLKAKEAAEKKVMEDPEVLAKILESEVDLNVQLFLDGKVAPTAGISSSLFSSEVDWTMPEHKGADWIKTLYLMGSYDGLYLGREEIFDKYVTALENTDVYLMESGINRKGKLIQIGHMIFDHNMPGSETLPESFTRVGDFIGELIGEDLSKLPKNYTLGEHGLLTNMVTEFYSNLAYRVYLSDFKFFDVTSTPEIKIVNANTGRLRSESKINRNLMSKAERNYTLALEQVDAKKRAIQRLEKASDIKAALLNFIKSLVQPVRFKSAAKKVYKAFTLNMRPGTTAVEFHKAELALHSAILDIEQSQNELDQAKNDLKPKINDIEKQYMDWNSILTKSYIPPKDSLNYEFAVDNLAKREAIDSRLSSSAKRRKFLKEEVSKIVQAVLETKGSLGRISREVLFSEESEELIASLNSRQLDLEVTELNEYLEELVDFYKSIEKKNSEYANLEIINETFRVDPSADLIEEYEELKAMYGVYTNIQNRVLHLIQSLMAKNENFSEDVLKLYGSAEAFDNAKPDPGSLLAKKEALVSEHEALAYENSSLEYQKQTLLDQYIKNVIPEYYKSRQTLGELEMDVSLENFADNQKSLKETWTKWIGIRKGRPPEEKTSLY